MTCATKNCEAQAIETSFLCGPCKTAEGMREYHQMRYLHGDVDTGNKTPQRTKARSMKAFPDKWEDRDCPVCGTAMDVEALKRSNQKYCSVDCRKVGDNWARTERRRKAKAEPKEKPQEFKLMMGGEEVKL